VVKLMKIFPILAVISILLSCGSGLLFAAMRDETQPDLAINTVVQERLNAQQEYQAYIANKQAKEADSKTPIVKSLPKPSADLKNKKDMIIGVVLIFIAIVLTIRLYQLSKRKQA